MNPHPQGTPAPWQRDIVLTTLNAKYIHASFGLRYLLANLGKLRDRTALVEFDINQKPLQIAESLASREAQVIGFGVYIWNVRQTIDVIEVLRAVSAKTIIVVGGPEASYELDSNPIVAKADYVITGEADLAFAQLCDDLLSGNRPRDRILHAPLPDFEAIKLPYAEYTAQDTAHRVIYVEASRGCPFSCEFCLSSLDIPVRQVPLEPFLCAMRQLLDRGARQLKFVDRTFNLDIRASRRILDFLLENYSEGRFFHFEMVPDRLPDELREVVGRFPPGALQFEVGIQTFNPEVGARIKRRQNYARLEENLRYLRTRTGVHIHADLIAGLPGETLESFAQGFDRLIRLGPHEIQVGILKRLRGTPIAHHDAQWEVHYNPNPPYGVLRNRSMDFFTVQKLHRFARYWDLVGNSGNFVETTPLIWAPSETAPENGGGTATSPFWAFLQFSEWLYQQGGKTDSIALVRLMELLFEYLSKSRSVKPAVVAQTLWRDYQRGGRRDKPAFLKDHLRAETAPIQAPSLIGTPPRQLRHLAGR